MLNRGTGSCTYVTAAQFVAWHSRAGRNTCMSKLNMHIVSSTSGCTQEQL